MKALIATRLRRVAWAVFTFLLAATAALCFTWMAATDVNHIPSNGDIMKRFLAMLAFVAIVTLALLSACAQPPATAVTTPQASLPAAPAPPFMAQVVGVQWLNPLQRRDYPTEWQLLWTLGLAAPNQNDDMVRTKPQKYPSCRQSGD